MKETYNQAGFDRHLKKHPEIYALFEHYALQAAQLRSKYSARGIFHRMRWHSMVGEKDSFYKINNNWSPYYAKKFMDEHPQYQGFFDTRAHYEGEAA